MVKGNAVLKGHSIFSKNKDVQQITDHAQEMEDCGVDLKIIG
jgi:hypothetical protein